jgi:hypothetical protein
MTSRAAAVSQAGDSADLVGQGGALERHRGLGISILGTGRSGTHRRSCSMAEVVWRMGTDGEGVVRW